MLLGLLSIEPMSGYDLGQAIRGSVGHFWSESYGQIYPNLKRLANLGFVRCRTERQKGRPDRNVYSITEKGRERLRKWLAVSPQLEVPRNELLLKLFFGDQASPETLIAYVESMAEQCRALLHTLDGRLRQEIAANQHYPAAPYWRMAAEYGQMEMRAHLRWAEQTSAKLRKIAAIQVGNSKAPRENKHADN